jgi:hypothetical protein
MTFTKFTDPAHGWLHVTLADIARVGLRPDDFSEYSYRLSDDFYLEEDDDAPKFITAWRAKEGKEPIIQIEHSNSTSFVQSLLPIRRRIDQ